MAYSGSIELISGITQKNNGNFPLVDASAVRVKDNERLNETIVALNDSVNNLNALIGYQDLLLGMTPYTVTQETPLKLSSDSETSYYIEDLLVADIDHNQGISYNDVTYEKVGSEMIFTCSGSAWDTSYATMNVSSLTVGSTYTFNTSRTYRSGTSPMYFVFKDSNDTLIGSLAAEGSGSSTYSFTAPDTVLKIEIYPVTEYPWEAYGIREGTCESLELVTTLSGTFNGTLELSNVNAGAIIESSPSCKVMKSIPRYNYNEISLGSTPFTVNFDDPIRLSSNVDTTYTIDNIFVADLEHNERVTYTNVTYAKQDGVMTFTCTGESRNSCLVNIKLSNIKVGSTYTFKTNRTYQSGTSPMSFIFYDNNGETIYSLEAESTGETTYSFVAPTSIIRIYVFPVGNYAWETYNIRVGTCNSFALYNSQTGSFEGDIYFDNIPQGALVSTVPSCDAYRLKSRIDDQLNADSTNAIQNKTVTAAINDLAGRATSRHYGKKCVFLGDSVAAFRTPPEDIPSIVGLETGMETYNCAFGGCRISDTVIEEGYLAFCLVKLADAIVSGDWTLQDANINYLIENDSSYYSPGDHYATLKAVDWDNIDFLIIHFAGNDPGGVVIDDAQHTDSTTTYLGAFRYSIKKILTEYPHLKILVIGTDYHKYPALDLDTDTRTYTINDVVYHYYDWSDALMEECKNFKIPCLDWYRSNGLNSLTVDYYMTEDGTHPNYMGNKLLAGQIAAKLMSAY